MAVVVAAGLGKWATVGTVARSRHSVDQHLSYYN